MLQERRMVRSLRCEAAVALVSPSADAGVACFARFACVSCASAAYVSPLLLGPNATTGYDNQARNIRYFFLEWYWIPIKKKQPLNTSTTRARISCAIYVHSSVPHLLLNCPVQVLLGRDKVADP